jgi:hypothetical protein
MLVSIDQIPHVATNEQNSNTNTEGLQHEVRQIRNLFIVNN